MPRYAYSAFAANGDLEKGELHADSEVGALDMLTARGLTPVSLIAGGSAEPWWQRDISLTGGKAAASPDALEHFFRTLAALLEVRFPLPRALRFCQAQARDRGLGRVLSRVTDAVNDGRTLAAAMRAEDGYFPDRFVAMIEVGEAANKLPAIAARAADTLAAEAERRRELRSALLYPAILLVMSLLVLALLVFYLAPTLTPVFANAQAEPPPILRAMTGLREALLTGWPVLVASVLALVLLMRLARPALRGPAFRLALQMPVLGTYLRQVNTLGICQTLALMLSSGAPLPRAVATARDAAPEGPYRQVMTEALDTISAGGTLSDRLRSEPILDPMARAMIEAGEESDQLGPVLDRIVGDLRGRSGRTLSQAIRLMTPVLTLLIGVGVGAVILSTVTAIMNLNDIAF